MNCLRPLRTAYSIDGSELFTAARLDAALAKHDQVFNTLCCCADLDLGHVLKFIKQRNGARKKLACFTRLARLGNHPVQQ